MAGRSDELDQIFRNCRDKNYIIRNTRYLKTFFDARESRELLATSLTTAKGPIAVRLVDILELDVVPELVLNQHTYTSFYWLCRLGRLPPERFERAKRQFEVMDGHERMFEDTEREYIMQQIESRRRGYRREKTPESRSSIGDLGYPAETDVSFVIDVDEFIDVSGLAKQCPEETARVFCMDEGWQTLALMQGDPLQPAKQARLRQIRSYCRTGQPVLVDFRMECDERRQADELCSILLKLDRHSVDFYLSTLRPLSEVLCVLFTYYSGYVQFERIIRISAGQSVRVAGKRALHFGKHGAIAAELLDLALNSYISARSRCAPER